ncbi:MAG: TrmH family RNA methyltransferase [Polyangiaceae bacterium]|nr:TrmH family RNA methyltransferase [Polyangiaceae bacterium]
MALLSPLDASAEEVRATLAPLRNDFSVALYTAENAFAIGAVIRVAHSFLAREIILVGRSPYYEKASMGMEKFETIVRVPDDEALLAHIGNRPLLAIEKDYATTSLYDMTFPKDVVLLFGSERFGIPKHIVRKANLVVGIPIYGVNHSLPLAVASGIVMSEWARRRYRNGATA